MNYSEFVRKVADRATFSTAKQAEEATKAIFDTLTEVILSGEPVKIADFGKFSITGRIARNGVNPRTGEPMRISASKAVTFKTSTVLKAKVNA
ncbi:MAG: HU family DNA-binding protein [Patescibacteria group bacterium]